jgi:hypothetical protein
MVFCPDELKPVLCARSLLGHNGNQFNTLFHIELVLLYRFAIERIGDLPQRMDIASKTLRCNVVMRLGEWRKGLFVKVAGPD